jgi:hypothetical protein
MCIHTANAARKKYVYFSNNLLRKDRISDWKTMGSFDFNVGEPLNQALGSSKIECDSTKRSLESAWNVVILV